MEETGNTQKSYNLLWIGTFTEISKIAIFKNIITRSPKTPEVNDK